MDFNEIKEWYVATLQKYVEFSGRSRRKEFWIFTLVNFAISVILAVLGLDFISTLFGLAVLLPGIGVSIRRLHDIGKTGWWLLIAFIPLVGLIVLIYFYVQEGDTGPNEYGPNPKTAI
ncbi:MAG TPA: DUF805 domain-containing protein [Balneolaceae bacterium]|nr:DUF805 domain-containing protein [Balneolaceae bacterium]